MKNLLSLLIILFSLNTVSYASFPVTEQEYEQVIDSSTEKKSFINTLVAGGGPGFGIAALCCGILGFFFLPFLLGPCAIVFGALGLRNSGRGMAIAGLILGIIQVLIVLLAVLFLASLGYW